MENKELEQKVEEVVSVDQDVVEDTVVEEGPGIVLFDYADFKLKCNCGHVQTMRENVQGGLALQLYCTDYHSLTLACEKCGNTLTAFFEEASNPPVQTIEEIMEDVETLDQLGNENSVQESVQEEDKA